MAEKKMKVKRDNFWTRYYVYIISSLVILIAFAVVMIPKHFWPFGAGILVNGDFELQGWPFVLELKHKIMSGESLLYTWNAGYGTNFYSIFTYGLFNPSTLIFMLVPEKYFLQASTVLLVINMILINCSMIYYLSHRPTIKMKSNDLTIMLFSLSYTLCMYMVSNINNWTFLIVAAIFPIIILGLEEFVANKGWKLYFFSLFISVMFNYYFTGLFCIFIVLYYLTLDFDNFKTFFLKSLKIAGLSFLSWAATAVFMIPTAVQMMQQEYTKSEYREGYWFTTVWDVLKYFFLFNNSIDRGSEVDSYGEVNLYFGLLLLLLTTLYFFNKKIKLGKRLKKLAVFLFYMIAFDTNILNYYMHMGHYPTYFPNRFSLFFTFFCIVLAFENWTIYREDEYKNVSIASNLVVGIGWTILTVICFAFASTTSYEYIYYYSITVFLVYMVALLLLPLLKKKWSIALAIIGCIELVLNFDYQVVFRTSMQDVYEVMQYEQEENELIQKLCVDEKNGFSRVLTANDVVAGSNSGMLYNKKSTSIFASSMSDIQSFLIYLGVNGGGNNIKPYVYTPITMSLLNMEYIFYDNNIVDGRLPEELYSNVPNLFDQYTLLGTEDDISVYENETVLSVGYMMPTEAQHFFDKYSEEYAFDVYNTELMNDWVESMTGISDVIEERPVGIGELSTLNIEAMVVDNQYYATQMLSKRDIEELSKSGENVLICNGTDVLIDDESDKKDYTLRLFCKAMSDGDYFVQVGEYFAPVGYVEEGEEFYIYYKMTSDYLEGESGLTGTIKFYAVNEENWQKAYEILAKQQLQVTEYSSSGLEGTIDVLEDGVMFMSVPCDDGWTLYVDGVEAEINALFDNHFIGVDLTKGTHTIRLAYHQKGLGLGIACSIFILLLVGVWIVLEKKGVQIWVLEKEKPEEELEANSEEAGSESTDSEEAGSEETGSEETDSEKTGSEETDSEKTGSGETDSEETDSKETDSEETDSEEAGSEEAGSEE